MPLRERDHHVLLRIDAIITGSSYQATRWKRLLHMLLEHHKALVRGLLGKRSGGCRTWCSSLLYSTPQSLVLKDTSCEDKAVI